MYGKKSNVERIIPKSLLTFLSLHFEGMDILETSWILWCQKGFYDRVYNVSNHKKIVN